MNHATHYARARHAESCARATVLYTGLTALAGLAVFAALVAAAVLP